MMGRLSLKWIDLKKATKKNKKEHKETELDKASIELFNKDIEEEIEKRKRKNKKIWKLCEILFYKTKRE